MLPLQIERVAERDAGPQESLWERVEGALLLMVFAAATIGWCSLLAMMLWKVLFWFLARAG